MSRIQVISSRRFSLDSLGPHVDLMLLRRGDHYYVARRFLGGSINYGLLAKGSSLPQMRRYFNLERAKLRAGGVPSSWPHQETPTPPPDEARLLKWLSAPPPFGINWNRPQPPPTSREDFARQLAREVGRWKGTTTGGLPVTRHPYWPQFRIRLEKALRKKYGNRPIRLFRGIRGKQAREVMEGSPFVTNELRSSFPFVRPTSWTPSKSDAREYTDARREAWVLLQVEAPLSWVVLAPVVIPGWIDPCVLCALSRDVYGTEEEIILSIPEGLLSPQQFRIAAATKRGR